MEAQLAARPPAFVWEAVTAMVMLSLSTLALVTTNTDTPLLTVREAATRLNISMRTARRMIKRGDLPALKISGS